MKKHLNLFLATLTVTSLLGACRTTDSITTDTSLINPNNNTISEFSANGQSTKRFSLSFKTKITDQEIKTLESKYNTKFEKIIPQIGIAIAEKPAETQTDPTASTALIEGFKAESVVQEYEPINQVKLEETTTDTESFKSILSGSTDASTEISPSSSRQYQMGIINASKGWEITRGKANIKIAIIDSGIDLNHPDLKSKIVSGTNIVSPGSQPMDDNGHGTHVAGIAAAATDSSMGISGVAPGCSLMPVKALKNGAGTDIDIAEGIVWAADHGADVINISIGLYTKSTAMERAVKYAINKNVVVVSSAGNDSKNSTIHLPSMIKGVIEVSATTKQDKFASFSNYGQQISVSAPGDNIYSTMPTYNVTLTSEAGGKKGYGTLSGTSMASPMVAGLAALLKSQNKALTPQQIKTKIEASALDLGKKGYDSYFGNGRIDLLKTLK